MDPIFYVIAIMGCGEGDMGCSPARVESARYPSEAACRAAMPQVLRRNSDLAVPVIAGDCRRSGPVMVQSGNARRQSARRAPADG